MRTKLFIFVCIASASSILPAALETQHVVGSYYKTLTRIKDLDKELPKLTKEDLFVFDFDDTLYLPDTEKLAEEMATKEAFAYVKQSGCLIMVLTARLPCFCDATLEEFSKTKIDQAFSANIPSSKLLNIKLQDEWIIYKDGFLFCGKSGKGTALIKFLGTIGLHPRSIYFIDDNEFNVLSVQQACFDLKTPFRGFHYTFVKNRQRHLHYPTYLYTDPSACTCS